MQTESAYLVHYLVGAAAVLCWWGAILSRKGGPRHRAFGKVFLAFLAATLASVGLILFAAGRSFAPPQLIQFTYLVLCVVTVGGSAFAAIRLKRDVERFRGPLFRLLGIAAFVMGGVVLAAGLATGQVMPVIFSVIGLLYGGAMIRFAWFRGPLHPRWWLGWHLNGMCFLFNAVHGTLLAVTWRALVDPAAGDAVSATAQLGTMAVSLALRLWFGRRFDAPLRFGASGPAPQPA